jgi:PEP-CTERM motif
MRYLNNSQVGSVHFNVLGPDAGGGRTTANWSLITANFSRVDEVIISGSGSAFLHDNTQIDPAVPEPSTWAMMLLGFAGLGFLAYRRQEKTVPLIGTP